MSDLVMIIKSRLEGGLYTSKESLPESLKEELYDWDLHKGGADEFIDKNSVPYFELVGKLMASIEEMNVKNKRVDDKQKSEMQALQWQIDYKEKEITFLKKEVEKWKGW